MIILAWFCFVHFGAALYLFLFVLRCFTSIHKALLRHSLLVIVVVVVVVVAVVVVVVVVVVAVEERA